jgi:hypothetical protein
VPKNLAAMGLGNPDRTSRSESLSRLGYPGSQTDTNVYRRTEIRAHTHIFKRTYYGDSLGLFSFIKRRKGSRILVDKIQNKYSMISDGFVFIYTLNPVIGSTEQKSDLCCMMWGAHLVVGFATVCQ